MGGGFCFGSMISVTALAAASTKVRNGISLSIGGDHGAGYSPSDSVTPA